MGVLGPIGLAPNETAGTEIVELHVAHCTYHAKALIVPFLRKN